MNLFLNIVMSSIGLGYFVYGKKNTNIHFLIFGILLMSYSYFTQNIIISSFVGILFVIAPFFTTKFL